MTYPTANPRLHPPITHSAGGRFSAQSYPALRVPGFIENGFTHRMSLAARLQFSRYLAASLQFRAGAPSFAPGEGWGTGTMAKLRMARVRIGASTTSWIIRPPPLLRKNL